LNEIRVDLSAFNDRFAETSFQFSISKKVNFLFGKNGTGKSTIAQSIKEQLTKDFNIFLFDGFEGIIGENNRLDAIALVLRPVNFYTFCI